MATVTGVTAERAQEIEDGTIADANIVGNDLVFTLGDGVTTINVGRIIPPAVSSWPVGSIFMNTSPTNPTTLLGGGTWVRWGKGRMPISLDEANTSFDTPEETGGEQNHTLTVAELAQHDHGGNTGTESVDHTHSGYTSSPGDHQHTYVAPNVVSNGPAAGSTAGTRGTVGAVTGAAGAHTHNVQTYGVSVLHTHAIPSQGGGAAHNNMPPFITVYMWKRTA